MMFDMKRAIITAVLLIGLCSCGPTPSHSTANPPAAKPQSGAEIPPVSAAASGEAAPRDVTPVLLDENIIDIGATLYPNQTIQVSGKIVNDNLMVWSENGSFLYDYQASQILYASPLTIIPLGTEHYYSQEQRGETSYLITLYNQEFDILAQHESEHPALPAVDGKSLLLEGGQIAVLHTETETTEIFDLQDVAADYTGGIWVSDFDGEWVFFGTTCNPMPGNPGFGAYNVLTGEAIFHGDQHISFSGIPECFGHGKALFWQDGSAHGTDGTYCIVLDAATGEFQEIDVGENACRVSDNSSYIASLSSSWEREALQVRLGQISVYRADTLQPLYSYHNEFAISSDYGISFSGISVSNDGKNVCFDGRLGEEHGKQTLFLCKMQPQNER